ncbi:MAG: hypothetical protein LAN62_15625 [Acidobacteriia bacterium]|nr:hypothetical protein [Terriglobia bacterium]
MKLGVIGVVTILLAGAMAWPQEEPSTTEQQPSEQPREQRRPTLGPAPAPSLGGPRTSSTTDARRLLRVRKIYLEQIENRLTEKLVEGFGKARGVAIVADRNQADAVMRGTCFDSRRLKTLRSEVYLNDRSGASIWQDSIHLPFNPPPLDSVVNQTADRIVADLMASIMEAQRR